MAGFTCPYCNQVMSVDNSTKTSYEPSFRAYNDPNSLAGRIKLMFYKCPNCEEYTIYAQVVYDKSNRVVPIRPISTARQFPDYVPAQIRNDYEEACAILTLSPKASATLARRCLQGMIRDYWGITKANLYQEISALKDKIDPTLWEVLDNLRQLGNIGAHMEADVNLIIDIEPDEAENLIKLIELLIKEWYVAREERKRLFGEINFTNAEKQALRKGN